MSLKSLNYILTQSITLETQKVQLEQQVAEAAAKYTNEHPVMQQMNAQLGAINKQIAELEGTLEKAYLNYNVIIYSCTVKLKSSNNFIPIYSTLTNNCVLLKRVKLAMCVLSILR